MRPLPNISVKTETWERSSGKSSGCAGDTTRLTTDWDILATESRDVVDPKPNYSGLLLAPPPPNRPTSVSDLTFFQLSES